MFLPSLLFLSLVLSIPALSKHDDDVCTQQRACDDNQRSNHRINRQERASSLLLPCWNVCVSLFIYQSIMFYLIATIGKNKWNKCQNKSCGMGNFGGVGGSRYRHQRLAVISAHLLQAELL